MVRATALARGDASRPPPTLPHSTAELVHWARQQSQAADGVISKEAYRTEINTLADAIATIFTNPYLVRGLTGAKKQIEKPAAPYTGSCRLLREAARSGGGGHADGQWEDSVQLFDFSESKRMASAAEMITGVKGSKRAKPLLLCFAGDALQEPFWPEGLGINRGVHNAQDSAWAVNQWRHASTDDERSKVVAERQACYEKFTYPMSGKNRKALRGHDPSSGRPLEHKERLFMTATVDPSTRYNVAYFGFRPLRPSVP